MADVTVSTRAIRNILANPKQLKAFKITPRGANLPSDYKEYLDILVRRASALVFADDEHREKFARFIELEDKTASDFAFLCDKLIKTFPNCDFKINPILELYEALIRENWTKLKGDRDILDSIDAFKKTPMSNVKICEAIVKLLKDHINEITTTDNAENNI